MSQAPVRPVSMLVAAYNAETTIDATLASLAAGTHLPAEVIVIDDGSQDDTAGRARRWADHLPLRIVGSPANEGLAAARNRGLAAATSPVVGILDSDDVVLPDHVRLLSDAYDRRPGIVSPGALYWLPDGRMHAYHRRGRRNRAPQQASLDTLLCNNYILVASFAPADLVRRIGGFRGFQRDTLSPAPGHRGVVEDWDMWLRLVANGAPVSFVPVPTLLYRVRDTSLASGEVDLLQASAALVRTFAQEHPGRSEHAVARSLVALDRRLRLAEIQAQLRASGTRASVGQVRSLLSTDWRLSVRALGLGVLPPDAADRLLGRRGAW